MNRTETGTGGRVSEARARLLSTAGRLFYAEGIRTVGVDRLVAEAKITNATFYRHFRSKEDLAVAYLESVDQAIRSRTDSLMAAGPPADSTLRGIGESLAEQIRSPGFRGCAFLNAAAEFPDPGHPVHRAVVHHRAWFLRTVTALFARIPGAPAENAGRHFVMLRDGAMSTGCLDDPVQAGETLRHGIEGMLRIFTGHAHTGGTSAASGEAPPPATTISGTDCTPPGV